MLETVSLFHYIAATKSWFIPLWRFYDAFGTPYINSHTQSLSTWICNRIVLIPFKINIVHWDWDLLDISIGTVVMCLTDGRMVFHWLQLIQLITSQPCMGPFNLKLGLPHNIGIFKLMTILIL